MLLLLLTLMLLAEKPVFCKSNSDLFDFFKAKMGPLQGEQIPNQKLKINLKSKLDFRLRTGDLKTNPKSSLSV